MSKRLIATPLGKENKIVNLTANEIAAKEAQLKAYKDRVNKDYIRNRKREYPSIGDQLDTIWKEMKSKYDGGETYSEDAIQMLGKIMDVKTKYPKPE